MFFHYSTEKRCYEKKADKNVGGKWIRNGRCGNVREMLCQVKKICGIIPFII